MKKIMGMFIRDHLFYGGIYFANLICLVVFFSISGEKPVEFMYPLGFSSFFFLIFIGLKGRKYYCFHKNLAKMAEHRIEELPELSGEYLEISHQMNQIHNGYEGKMVELQNDHQKKIHFVSQSIHSLKTHITVVDLILEKVEQDGYRPGDTQSLKEENEHIVLLLEQVLNIIRLDYFSKDYEPTPINLEENLTEVINEMKSQFIYHQVFPKVVTADKMPLVLTDAKWNRLLMEQIISNSIKYSSGNNQAKYIYFSQEKKEGRVILTIRDEGCGIPEYDLGRIQEPFFTGENGRKFRNSTGIGLYICGEIAESLGVELSISSKQGQGTTVTLSYLSKS